MSAARAVSFGCRLNGVESDAMRAAAEAAGARDVVIVNSCAVTNEAARQARQAVRRIAREAPQARIVVTGCAAQIEPARFAAMPEVAHVLGDAEKRRAETWSMIARGEAPRIAVSDVFARRETGEAGAVASEGRTRAFLEVQNGCDHRCTFCIIPFGRGDSRSIAADAVVARAQALVDEGYAEIVLTGVDLTSWRDPEGRGLGHLVKRLLGAAPGLARLRLSSIDCVEADDDLLDVLGAEARFMPHLHLSLQAGDDLILKRMKRRHSHAQAVAFCRRLRALRPDIALGADLIVGFPTESEAMFQRSLDLVDACGITRLHVFPFSPRPGTPAARMPQVAPAAARERASRLREKGEAAMAAHLSAQVGRRLAALTERGGLARAPDFTPIATPGLPAGALVALDIVAHDGRRLIAAA